MIRQLIDQRKFFELIYSAVINKDVINGLSGDFGRPIWKVNYVKQVIRLQ